MGNSEQTDSVLRFHDFQVNLQTGELWKAGIRLKLQDQPFKVLATLLQRPGQVVPREELHQRIWPQESFGDFDHAINLAINKLRATLGDSADVPHLIETLPRRGYRFIAAVETLPSPKRNLVPPAINRLLPRWLLRFFDAIRKHPWPAADYHPPPHPRYLPWLSRKPFFFLQFVLARCKIYHQVGTGVHAGRLALAAPLGV